MYSQPEMSSYMQHRRFHREHLFEHFRLRGVLKVGGSVVLMEAPPPSSTTACFSVSFLCQLLSTANHLPSQHPPTLSTTSMNLL